MVSFLIRRLFWLIPVVVVVAAVTFFLMHRAPGGPWDNDKPMPQSAVNSLNEKFGLSNPAWINPGKVKDDWNGGERNPLALAGDFVDTQFFNYMWKVARGDMGPTYSSRGGESVQTVILRQFPVSLKIGLVGVLFAVLFGVPLGVYAGIRQNTLADYISTFLTTVGRAVPTFVSGLLLLILLSRVFHISPLKRPEAWRGVFSTAYLLPGIVLGGATMSYVARLTRSSVIETKRNDFVRTARAKGVAERGVIAKHILRNALLPVITILGPAAADLIVGSIVIEQIFNAPGLGRTFVEAISKRDYSVVTGVTIFYAVLIALANVLVDVSYGFIDPRIRSQR
jgi:oligopeptide transport system permease protein